LCAVCAISCFRPAIGADKNYLLINLTSYNTPEAQTAIDYSKAELKRGRPVVIFLNDRGVLVASRANAEKFKEQQQHLNELMKNGATVLICPHCMKLYGVVESDLLTGIQIAKESDHS
jgi:sulfur relay (sulfurtransferase) complex TusBCD TusD component (DsrE family)